MPIDIIVVRGDGDKDGGVIQDPLLSTLPAAIQRGVKELNDADDTETVEVDAAYTPEADTGLLLAVDDSNYGQVWVGRIMDVSHGVNGGAPRTLMSVRRKVWQTS